LSVADASSLSKPGTYRPTATSPLFGKSVAPKIDNRRSRRSSPVDVDDDGFPPVDYSAYQTDKGRRRGSLTRSKSDRGRRSETDYISEKDRGRKRSASGTDPRRKRSASGTGKDKGRSRRSPPASEYRSDRGRAWGKHVDVTHMHMHAEAA